MSRDRDRILEQALKHELRAAGTPPADACLDAETLGAWTDGGLDPAAMAAAEAHVSNCARCQALVGAMTQERAGTAAPAPAPEAPRHLFVMEMVAGADRGRSHRRDVMDGRAGTAAESRPRHRTSPRATPAQAPRSRGIRDAAAASAVGRAPIKPPNGKTNLPSMRSRPGKIRPRATHGRRATRRRRRPWLRCGNKRRSRTPRFRAAPPPAARPRTIAERGARLAFTPIEIHTDRRRWRIVGDRSSAPTMAAPHGRAAEP